MPGFELVGEEERAAVNKLFDEGGILFAHGFDAMRKHFYVREFEQKFADRFHAKHAQAVTSGSTALMVALKAMGVGQGDEVITQSFTFVATVEAILILGAIPVLTEIDDSYNMDPEDLRQKISHKTKAIIPVHMAGVPARMSEIMAIASEHGIPVLEDVAQGIGAQYDGKYMGTIGSAGAFSLDFGKTITSGEGGMVLTSDESIYKRALAYHDHGHEYNPSVGRADDTRHSWGFNFRMNELNAVVGMAQLQKLERLLDKSRQVKQKISAALEAEVKGIRFRTVPEKATENYDSIIFNYASKEQADTALVKLKQAGLGTKNIPDALKWHFSGYWEHMFQEHPAYNGCQDQLWHRSKDLLQRSIALPVMVNWNDDFVSEHIERLIAVLNV